MAEVSGLWLYAKDGSALAVLREGSAVATRRFREHSEISAKFALAEMPGTPYATNYDALSAAYFVRIGGLPEVFLAEHLKLVEARESFVEMTDARAATALLHTRTVQGTKDWENRTAGYMVDDMLAGLTGSRALPIAFGEGIDVGSTFSARIAWRDMGEAVLEILAAQGLGLSSTMGADGVVRLNVVAPALSDYMLGEKYKDGSSLRLIRDDREWRNYAYVVGEEVDPSKLFHTGVTLVAGTTSSGVNGNAAAASDGVYWQISENAGSGLQVDFDFNTLAGKTAGEFFVRGYYTGGGAHHMQAYAYNYETTAWDLLAEEFMPAGGATPADFSVPYMSAHIDATNRRAKMRLKHSTTTYNNSHRLWLDEVHITMLSPRESVTVDQTGSSERRELLVDAGDIRREGLNLTRYRAALAARGAARLAETRRIEFAEADGVTAPLDPGDVVVGSTGRWAATYMATEVTTSIEKGEARHSVSLGDPPPTLKRTIRRLL